MGIDVIHLTKYTEVQCTRVQPCVTGDSIYAPRIFIMNLPGNPRQRSESLLPNLSSGLIITHCTPNWLPSLRLDTPHDFDLILCACDAFCDQFVIAEFDVTPIEERRSHIEGPR